MNGFWSLGALLLCVAISTQQASAQQRGRHVIGAGGIRGEMGDLRLIGTTGQAIVGVARGATYQVAHGYWIAPRTSGRVMTVEAMAVAGREAASDLVVRAWPNPLSVGTEIMMRSPAGMPATLMIVDQLGHVVRAIVLKEHRDGEMMRAWIATDDLPSGRYMATLTAGAERRMIPLILVR